MGAGRFGAHGGGKKPAHHTRLREQREAGCRHAGHQTGRPARGRAERTHRRGATAASGHPVQFRVLVRWESAKPVRLAGGPELPELTGQFYVIRLRGLPLMPPPKTKPEEGAPNPNEGMLQAIEQGSRLERKDKPGIPCAHLFTGSGVTATEVLLFFPRRADPIQVADKLVILESRFTPFHLSVKFRLKDMMYKGELAL